MTGLIIFFLFPPFIRGDILRALLHIGEYLHEGQCAMRFISSISD